MTGHAGGRGVAVCTELPGVVADVLVAPGDTVLAGDEIAVVESMKMEIPILAGTAGTVDAVVVGVGDAVARQDLLATVIPALLLGEDPGVDATTRHGRPC